MRSPLLFALLLVLALVHGSACGRRKVRTAKPPRIGSTEKGVASWYGHPYHGRRAANGEVYDMERLTAAHRTLPFNTWVQVSNLDNGKAVEVRIQDRGPFVDGRIIDLSRAAAREIEMIGPGTARVRLTVIAPPKQLAQQPELFAVQAGAYRDRDRAEAAGRSLEQFGPVRLVLRAAEPPVWRVLVGEKQTQADAEALAELVRASGVQAFAVRLDVAGTN
ncbi:MAG TPA: septal ring lytic transglycosylase RlpA family protein [Bryobacteraceae bacterium]|nr:septal ring lytic transglycosylase RlpA family protein [Bryobacteraceae bacterium]